MKKLNAMLILILCILLSSGTAQGAVDTKTTVKAGPGVGIPYGALGGNIEISPSDYFSLLAGTGVTEAGFTWVVGAPIYFTDRNQKIRPHLGYYRGTVAVETIRSYYVDDYENIDGTAAGFGIAFNINKHVSLDGEIIYILSNDPDLTLDSPFKIAFGVHF